MKIQSFESWNALKGQKHIAQGRAKRHPGLCDVLATARPERAKAHSPGQSEATPWAKAYSCLLLLESFNLMNYISLVVNHIEV